MYEKHGKEEIYAFALYSDEGALTVCPSTNTLESLKTKEGKSDYIYYKYEPAEWKYEMEGANKLFNEISRHCREEVDNIKDDEEFLNFQTQLYQTCIEVLEKLKTENYFRQLTDKDIFLIFTVTEYEFAREETENIIKKLNNNNYKDEYINWMKTWN